MTTKQWFDRPKWLMDGINDGYIKQSIATNPSILVHKYDDKWPGANDGE